MTAHLTFIKRIIKSYSLIIALCLSTVWIIYAYISLPLDSTGKKSLFSMILTSDQQGQWYMKKENYKKAAQVFSNREQKAAALYRDGQFKDAAKLFGANSGPVSRFNQGTAFIMAGLYDDAIHSFEKSLEADPDLEPARINLEIAKIRKEKNTPAEEDAGGTGGMLEADEFVFSDKTSPSHPDQTEEVDSGASISDAQMRALWLRRLESSPKDFLRVKFAYQNARPKDQE